MPGIIYMDKLYQPQMIDITYYPQRSTYSMDFCYLQSHLDSTSLSFVSVGAVHFKHGQRSNLMIHNMMFFHCHNHSQHFFMFQHGSPPFARADCSEVAHHDVTLTTDCFQIGHGKSTFLKGDRVQKMQREAAGCATTGGLGPCLLHMESILRSYHLSFGMIFYAQQNFLNYDLVVTSYGRCIYKTEGFLLLTGNLVSRSHWCWGWTFNVLEHHWVPEPFGRVGQAWVQTGLEGSKIKVMLNFSKPCLIAFDYLHNIWAM